MLNYDDLLQAKLTEIESGAPVEQVIASLPPEASGLAELLRIASAVRSMPHPEPLLETVQVQRKQVRAAAEAHTQPLRNPAVTRPAAPARRWNWNILGGAAAFAAVGAFVFLCAALAVLGAWIGGRNRDTAQITALTGQAQVATNRSATHWKNLERGDRIRQGQRIRTLGASSVALTFPEGTRTYLSPQSDVTFTRLNVSGSTLQVELAQNSGETWNTVIPLQGETSYFRVNTPSGTASVHGTDFNVRVGAAGQAQFAVNTGEVRVKNDGQEVVLTAGQATAGDPGGALAEPTYLFHLQGSLMDINEETGIWTVSGTGFVVDAHTMIVGAPQLGSVVSVSGRLLVDGTRVADIIEPSADLEQVAFFTGTLEAMGERWIISGKEVMVSSETILDPGLAVGVPVKVTFNTLQDGTWLAMRIETLLEEPVEPTLTVTPSATADPSAMPSYEFSPDEVTATSCDDASSYQLTGTLRNTAVEAKDYAANVELDYLIDAGGEYVSSVDLIPAGWERIDAGQAVNFAINVAMNGAWANASDDTEVKLRIYIASATNRPDHTNGQLTVTIKAGCVETTVTPTVTETPTPTGTLQTETPTMTPTGATPTAVTPTVSPTVVPTNLSQCTGADPHPTGMKLAQRYGVPYEEIMYWFCQGHYGFGEIDLAYALSRESGRPVEEIFAMRASGMGWGEIKKVIHNETQDGDDDQGKDKHDDDDDEGGDDKKKKDK